MAITLVNPLLAAGAFLLFVAWEYTQTLDYWRSHCGQPGPINVPEVGSPVRTESTTSLLRRMPDVLPGA